LYGILGFKQPVCEKRGHDEGRGRSHAGKPHIGEQRTRTFGTSNKGRQGRSGRVFAAGGGHKERPRGTHCWEKEVRINERSKIKGG